MIVLCLRLHATRAIDNDKLGRKAVSNEHRYELARDDAKRNVGVPMRR
jgi:hypothetical protein